MIYNFAEFELDTRRCELRHAGQPVHLEPQEYAVLTYLVENAERLVTREELLDHIWGHRFVTPATLNTRIKALRQALGDDGDSQRIIRTIRGRGFRMVEGVESREAAPSSPTTAGATRLPVGSAVEAEGAAPGATTRAALVAGQRIHFCRAADGAGIAYAVSGQGPPLVKTANWLTHLEFDWNSPIWRHWLDELSREHTLIRYDERGNGLSDRDAADLSFEAWVADLETVVDAVGLERFPLFGLSQGCAVAVEYTVRHPERVTGLVLYGGFPLGRYRRTTDLAGLAEARTIVEVMPLGWGRDNPAFRQFFASVFLPEGSPEQMSWFSDLQRVTATPETAVRLRTAAANIDVVEAARRVRVPTLILHATGDAAVPFDQGRLFASLIAGSRFVPLSSRNHILLETEPAWGRFVEEVRCFLGELRGRDGGSPAR